ncbi:MAG: hypothetical protein ACHQUC_01405 [Chlamydiales bacterium]
MKHTPGPWIVHPDKISQDCDLPDLIIGPKLGEQVCHVYIDNENDVANAALIATAPELLEIVELILLEWEKPTEGVLPGELIARLSQHSHEAREVIKKAKGEL